MIYLDNGATSFPKPSRVREEMTEAIRNYCANPGRAGHFMADRTAREIFGTRLALARLLGIEDAGRILFTKNCTEAINMALYGILRPGDHVITSSMEHNSVLRPLKVMEREAVRTTVVRCAGTGELDAEEIRAAIRGDTRMIVLTAASNVTGTKMPLEEVGRMALRRGILFMVDGAQGAGHMDLNVKRQHIDILAAPGHKGLMGPQGTGFLYLREGIEMEPLLAGGTGTRSRQLEQPRDFPEGYEAGTVNVPGLIGLGAAAGFIEDVGLDVILRREEELTLRLQTGLERISGVRIYGPADARKRTAIVALNIEGYDSEEAALLLNDKYGIAVRAGLHCSGLAHETIGTADGGCIRMCPGFYTSESEIDETIEAVAEMAGAINAINVPSGGAS